MSQRNLLVGLLLTLIIALSSYGLLPFPRSARTPGLENVVSADMMDGIRHLVATADMALTREEGLLQRFVASRPARAMNSRPQGGFLFDGAGSGVAASPPAEPEPVVQEPRPVAGSPPAASVPGPTASAPPSSPPADPAPSGPASSPPAAPTSPVPVAPAEPTGPAGFFNYTVKSGDDLGSIAQRYGTTPETIAAESGIPATQTLYAGMSLRVPTDDSAQVEPPLAAVAVPWSEVNNLWKVGTVAQVTDVRTGRIFYVMRRGGWAHSDSEPVSKRDTATMLSNYGGAWNWARRPIVVVINGRRIAASQNGMPHGGSTLDNNFPGHFCIHFLGSTTHGSSYTSNGVPTLDAAHQRCVQEAVGH